MNNENVIEFDIELYINILSRFGKFKNPALKIYKKINDPILIKLLAKKAVKKETFIGKIHIKDQWKATSKLIELGIITKNDLYKTKTDNTNVEKISLEIFIRSLDIESPMIELKKMITDNETMNFISKKALSQEYFISDIQIGNIQKAIDTFISLGFIKPEEYYK
jgi:hypothetical protein